MLYLIMNHIGNLLKSFFSCLHSIVYSILYLYVIYRVNVFCKYNAIIYYDPYL